MILVTLLLGACEVSIADAAPDPPVDGPSSPEPGPASDAPPSAAGDTVGAAFPPPDGALQVDGGAFGEWLQSLPIRAVDAQVRTHDGRVVTAHRARVVDMPVVDGDLQQCADSIIRVRSEWLRETGAEISWRATSGDPLPWSRYQAGERPYVVDDRIQWRASGDAGDDDALWDGYLQSVFTWAGTASMEVYETTPLDGPGEARPGDVLVQGGFLPFNSFALLALELLFLLIPRVSSSMRLNDRDRLPLC